MLNLIKSFFGANSADSAKIALTIKDVEKKYEQHPSISAYLPWTDYDPESKCFLLEDGKSVGFGFICEDVASEARPEKYLADLRDKFQRLFQDTVPQERESPWILQFYLQDERSFKSVDKQITDYIKPEIKDTQLTKNYLKILDQHNNFMTRKEGLFFDKEVTGTIFKGKYRRIRLVAYRRIDKKTATKRKRSILQDAMAVAKNIYNQLQNCGIKAEPLTAERFREWLIRWFNPQPVLTKGNVDCLLDQNKYPGDDNLPYGYNLTEQVFFSIPESDSENGTWIFDKKPHKFITIQALSAIPEIGHLSAELPRSHHWYSLFDKFPENSIFCLTVVIEDQNTVKEHIKSINDSAVGDDAEAQLARRDCQQAFFQIEQGNYLYPTVMGVYISADNMQQLYDYEIETEILLNNNGLKPIYGDHDLTPLDAYLRYLPMSYDYKFDKKYTRRSRYIYAKQIANMLPLYGRYRGSGKPGMLRYNRGGEPLFFDILNRDDKSFNSHCLYFGSTGSGKSSALVGDLLHIMAVHRPKLFIIEKGNSFGLLADYFEKNGLTVNKVQLKKSSPIALNPFASGLRLVDELDKLDSKALDKKIVQEEEEFDKVLASLKEETEVGELEEDGERDILGEMALAARLMITGGEAKEEEKLTRQDSLSILNALYEAAKIAKVENAKEMIAEHVVRAFRKMADEVDAKGVISSHQQAVRLREMADGMDFFCRDHLSAQFFNTPGEPWPDVDVTVLDMGIMAGDQYEIQLALAVMGILNRVAAMAEANEYTDREIILVTDECHINLKKKLTAAQYAKHSKMARKLGWWLWFATQNMSDFPDEARKILSMIETWMIMGTSEEEIEEIKRFKNLTPLQHSMLTSVRKEIGKYTEGVILSSKIMGLYRNVPPRLAFTLAQTEKQEKVERSKLMQAFNISEIEAAEMIAERMMK